MDSRAKDLIQQGDQLFGKRSQLLSLWQETADNFYPERADFTVSRNLGDDFASHLMSSYPVLARRDLGNMLSAMLRRDEWFRLRADREELEDNEAKRWLEWASRLQRRAMYDRAAQFVRATKEGDHDFAAFGQCALQVELNRKRNTLLYRCWHLRDVAWCEDETGEIDTVHRKWSPSTRVLRDHFGESKLHEKVRQCLQKDPHKEIDCRHIVIPSDGYDGERKWRTPFVSLYIDVENHHVIEEKGIATKGYVIPRWQTVSGSQYAYSPATVAALPDARLIQAMTRVLLEAGEKYTNPPMLAVQEAIRSDIAIFAGGVTWVDSEYDERLGEVLRPLTQDKSGIPLGMEQSADVRAMIAEAFYLNKISLPPPEGDMTAYEVGQRIQDYVRQALPLFEPMEMDYNGGLCNETFDILIANGAFGPPESIPDSLRGNDVRFVFESPLTEAMDRKKGQRFIEVRDMLLAASEVDQGVVMNVDIQTAFRDAIDGIGAPAEWLMPERQVAQAQAKRAQMQQMQQAMQSMGEGAQVAEQVGKAGQALTGTEG